MLPGAGVQSVLPVLSSAHPALDPYTDPHREELKLRKYKRRCIRRQLNAITPENSLPQTQSPLWSRLPPELRNHIFNLALAQHPDLDRPYPEDSWYYRPGYTHAWRIHIDLLLTCRLAYFETYALPLANATLPVWEDRGPPDSPDWNFANFTATNTALLNHVHFFIRRPNGYWFKPLPQLRPKRITITIRHTSWYGWPNDKPLLILDTWRQSLSPPTAKFPSCLTELVVELETVQRKRDQLDAIVARRVRNWRFPREDGTVLSPLATPPRCSAWTGSATFGGVKWRLAHGDDDTINYHVVAVTFTPEDPADKDTTAACGLPLPVSDGT